MVIADLHWASLRVLELLEAALARLASSAFALIATTRPGGELPTPPRPARLTTLTLRLEPLDRGAAGELLQAMLGDEATRALTDELYDRSGGNPLFLEELAELVGCGGEPAPAARLPAGPRRRPASTSCPSTSGPCSTTPRCSGRRARTARWSSSARRSARTSAARSSTRSPTPGCSRSRAAGGGSARPASARSRTTPSPRPTGPVATSAWPRPWSTRRTRPDGPTCWLTTGRRRPSWPASSAARLPGVPRDVVDEAVQALLASATHDVDRLYPRPAIEQVARALSIGDCQLDGPTPPVAGADAGRGLGRAAAVPRGGGRPAGRRRRGRGARATAAAWPVPAPCGRRSPA